MGALIRQLRALPRLLRARCTRRARLLRLALDICLVAMLGLFLIAFLRLFAPGIANDEFSSPYHYYCEGGLCKKAEITADVQNPLALSVCQLFCGEASTLWPKPTGHVSLGNLAVEFDPDNIELEGVELKSPVGQLLRKNLDQLTRELVSLAGGRPVKPGTALVVKVSGKFDSSKPKLTLATTEAYILRIYQDEGQKIVADIEAGSYFGLRHGVETLSQLCVYDDLRGSFRVARDVHISDSPAFPYRGVLLDTSRNFMNKAAILRTIRAMGMSKMNSFHWHITDSHSFPYVSRSLPNMSRYGAYSADKIYTFDDVREIVEFGLVNGVRVLPEFDAPAHVGEGWQWVGQNATVCFKAEPWRSYCVEPPCGQLNPTSDRVYEILGDIYADMMRDFEPDFFHMGGDEVNLNCWNSSNIIRDWMAEQDLNLSESSFYKLWNYFQSKAYQQLTTANGGKELDVVLWTSGLTSEENLKYLDPSKYIIQIWTTGTDPTIGRLIKNNFRVIFSNYDALYLDCGFGAWVGEGNNWCSPYIGWQKVYDNSPMSIIQKQGYSSDDDKRLILGGEAALWSEQVDSASVDARLWPRSAALAERLWSDPSSTWIHAEQRMLRHRERLVQRGVLADSLEPEWCLQNQGHCYFK